MKKIIYTFTFTCFAIIFLCISQSCKKQDTKQQLINISADGINTVATIAAPNPFNKKVGAPVDGSIGNKWIVNYKTKYGYDQSYMLKNSKLQAIIAQPNCVGISLYYALDDKGNTHILPIGVNAGGAAMPTATISTMTGNISWATAQQWIAKHPGLIDAHFLGSNTFIRLNSAGCENIRVDFAINDKGPQLLLSADCGVLNAAAKKYEDDSNPCPPYCK